MSIAEPVPAIWYMEKLTFPVAQIGGVNYCCVEREELSGFSILGYEKYKEFLRLTVNPCTGRVSGTDSTVLDNEEIWLEEYVKHKGGFPNCQNLIERVREVPYPVVKHSTVTSEGETETQDFAIFPLEDGKIFYPTDFPELLYIDAAGACVNINGIFNFLLLKAGDKTSSYDPPFELSLRSDKAVWIEQYESYFDV